jgi:NAD-dependent dihydropyrimidine dehydrogenase PreA subunit
MSPYDPWAAYAHIWEGVSSLLAEFPVGFAILVGTAAGSLLFDRFFCKYLCPMGAFLGIVSKISPHRIVRNEKVCIDCGRCREVCPVTIEVDRLHQVTSAECIECQLCTTSCPKEGALENKLGRWKTAPITAGMIILILYFAGIGIARIGGVYQLLPEPIAAGEIIPPEELKGYMTLEEIARYRGISIPELYKKLDIPSDIPVTTPGKALAELIPGFSFEKVRKKLQ